MHHRCIVNVATRPGDMRGQARLAQSIKLHAPNVPFLPWRNVLPPGSPPHSDTPYAFKVYAMEEAARRGFTTILWVDASVWFIRSPLVLFEWAENHGAYMGELGGGYVLGEWCSDAALEIFALGREVAMTIPLVYGGCVCICRLHDTGRRFMEWLTLHARIGTFRGPWTNEDGEASADRRVKGHRHDMTALSFGAHVLGCKSDKPKHLFITDGYGFDASQAVALCRGIP